MRPAGFSRRGALHLGDMRHVIFAVIMALFIVQIGQNWAHFSSALMTAAWVRHGGRLNDPIW